MRKANKGFKCCDHCKHLDSNNYCKLDLFFYCRTCGVCIGTVYRCGYCPNCGSDRIYAGTFGAYNPDIKMQEYNERLK